MKGKLDTALRQFSRKLLGVLIG